MWLFVSFKAFFKNNRELHRNIFIHSKGGNLKEEAPFFTDSTKYKLKHLSDNSLEKVCRSTLMI